MKAEKLREIQREIRKNPLLEVACHTIGLSDKSYDKRIGFLDEYVVYRNYYTGESKLMNKLCEMGFAKKQVQGSSVMYRLTLEGLGWVQNNIPELAILIEARDCSVREASNG